MKSSMSSFMFEPVILLEVNVGIFSAQTDQHRKYIGDYAYQLQFKGT